MELCGSMGFIFAVSISEILHALTCSCEVDVVGEKTEESLSSKRLLLAVKVVAGRCERWLADAGCCERWLLGTRVTVNAGRCERYLLCSEHP
jgi:hypothetical protein